MGWGTYKRILLDAALEGDERAEYEYLRCLSEEGRTLTDDERIRYEELSHLREHNHAVSEASARGPSDPKKDLFAYAEQVAARLRERG